MIFFTKRFEQWSLYYRHYVYAEISSKIIVKPLFIYLLNFVKIKRH